MQFLVKSDHTMIFLQNITDIWTIPTVNKDMLDFVPDILTKKIFDWKLHNE